jgi:hypothetical protein
MPSHQHLSEPVTANQAPQREALQPKVGGPLAERNSPSNTGSLFQAQVAAGSPRAVQMDGDEKKEEEGGGGASGSAAGLANYESTLGKWLGSKLYAAVSDQLTLDKLASYAESGVGAALGPLGDYIKTADGDVDPAVVDKAMGALEAALGKQAKNFVKAHGAGLQKALQGFVDASPELIVLLGLLAAAGAIAANMKIPDLSAKLKIADGLDARISARIGSLRDISLQKIEAKLTYQAGQLKATAAVAWEDEKGMSADMALKYGLRDDLDLSLSGSWSEEDGAGGRMGIDYRATDNISIGAYGGYDERKGANAGIGIKISF